MKRKEKTISEAGAKLPGISGAVVGAMFGSLPFALIMILLKSRGMYAVPFAIFVPFVSVYFYKASKGLRRFRWALVCVGISSVLILALTQLTAQSYVLSRQPDWIAAAAEYGVKPMDLAFDSLVTGENLVKLLPSLGLSALACVAGLCFSASNLAEYADLSKEDLSAIKKDEAKKEYEKKVEEEKERSEKRRNLPGRLERFGSDSDAPVIPRGEYRVAPYKLQKQYVGGFGAAVILLFGALAAFALYKGISGGKLRLCLLAVPAAYIIYQGVRLLLSVARYIEVKGKELAYRSGSGKIRCFNFDDISRCEKLDGRCLVYTGGELPEAFFNLGWENGNRLMDAIEDYRIKVEIK